MLKQKRNKPMHILNNLVPTPGTRKKSNEYCVRDNPKRGTIRTRCACMRNQYNLVPEPQKPQTFTILLPKQPYQSFAWTIFSSHFPLEKNVGDTINQNMVENG